MGIHANLAHPLIVCNRFVYETWHYGTIGGGFEANIRSGCMISIVFPSRSSAANGKHKSALLMNFSRLDPYTFSYSHEPTKKRHPRHPEKFVGRKNYQCYTRVAGRDFFESLSDFMIHWSLDNSITILLNANACCEKWSWSSIKPWNFSTNWMDGRRVEFGDIIFQCSQFVYLL